jgi:SOS-response transcriptional repressor LexA
MENLREIGQRIKKVRKELGLTQEEMAKKLGISRDSIVKYERGDNIPSQKFLKLLKYELEVNPEWILRGKGEMFLKKPTTENPKMNVKFIPIIGYISAGLPENTESDVLDWIPIPPMSLGDFAMIVDGTSMEPFIPKGSIVIVRRISSIAEVKNGDIVIVNIENEYAIKRFYIEDGKIILKSENKQFKDIVIDIKSLREVSIIGKVEALYLKF